MFDVSLLSPHHVVQWLNEPLADGGEEMRGMPRQPLQGMVSGHSIKGTRSVKLKDCGLTVDLVNVDNSVFDSSFKGLDGGLPAYSKLIRPNNVCKRFSERRMDESASLLRVVPTVIGLIVPLVPFKRGVTFRILRSVIVPLVAPPPLRRLRNSLRPVSPWECPRSC